MFTYIVLITVPKTCLNTKKKRADPKTTRESEEKLLFGCL